MPQQSTIPVDIIVAGHICVDIFPTFTGTATRFDTIFVPGGLTRTGPALAATGGAVSNTGQALHRLGVSVQLMGKIGSDLFGEAVLSIINKLDPALTTRMIIAPDEPSSYTIVLSAPGIDRIFLHYPGPNDTFGVADVDLDAVAQARYFHFGYPPLMRCMYLDGGRELETLMRGVRGRGVTTSLDMAQPDAGSESGSVDWEALLARVLPHVGIFAPSIGEILYMLDRPTYDALHAKLSAVDAPLLAAISARLLEMGTTIVLLKLAEGGLYLRTTDDVERLHALGKGKPTDVEQWRARELYAPAFIVQVQGTTGAGDCTIAGFLTAMLHSCTPEWSLTSAAAVGAFSVESADATSGVASWDVVQARIAGGWHHHLPAIHLTAWHELSSGMWAGPNDKSAGAASKSAGDISPV